MKFYQKRNEMKGKDLFLNMIWFGVMSTNFCAIQKFSKNKKNKKNKLAVPENASVKPCG